MNGAAERAAVEGAVRIRARAEYDDRVRRPERRGSLHGECGPVPRGRERRADDEQRADAEGADEECQTTLTGGERHGALYRKTTPEGERTARRDLRMELETASALGVLR